MAYNAFGSAGPRRGGSEGQVGKVVYGQSEADSMTFKGGHFVYVDGANGVTDAEPTTDIHGIAQKTATNVTSGNIEIPFEAIETGSEWYMRVDTGAGVLELPTDTLVVGLAYGIMAWSLTAENRIDSSNTTNKQFVFEGPVLDASGDETYWGRFRATDIVSYA